VAKVADAAASTAGLLTERNEHLWSVMNVSTSGVATFFLGYSGNPKPD
jgi:hypothetical protein